MLKKITLKFIRNINQVGHTFIIILIVVYLFAIFCYNFLNFQFYIPIIYDSENYCNDIFTCFFNLFNESFRHTGGVGDVLIRQTYKIKRFYYLRFIYDLSSFLFINIILLNMFIGNIIDTLKSININKNNMFDFSNRCAICGEFKNNFSNIKDFELHVTTVHNIWNYFYFIIYLKLSDKNNLNNFEKSILLKVNQNSIDWIPILKTKEENIELNILQKLDKINKLLKLINN